MSTTEPQPPQPRTIHWVDVRDHLPADDRVVLLYSNDGNGPTASEPPVWPGWRDDGESCWYWANGGLAETITHWAEMPEPPKP